MRVRATQSVEYQRNSLGKHFSAKLAPLLLVLSLLGCRSTQEKVERQREEQEAAKITSEMADLSSRYGAVVDWPQHLKGKAFTIDVEPVFLRADKRPALFYATLEDVRRQDDAIFLYFRTIPTEGEPTLQLILDCAGCNVQALKSSADAIGDFGVFAQVTAASKSLDESEDAPDYVLRGRFIDARFVGDYALDKALSHRR